MPHVRDLLNAVRAAVVASPSLPFSAGVGCILVWFGAAQGGFDATVWYPGALLVLALVVVAVLVVPTRPPARLVWLSVGCLSAYAAWSYLSVAWAAQKGDAWDGAGRTALYALVFALFSLWGLRGRAAAGLLGAYVLSISLIGLVELLRASLAAHPGAFFIAGRFSAPVGYQNADVALWFSAFWPAVALASRRGQRPLRRAVFVAAAVVLSGLALMGQSRGWLFVAPLGAVIFLVLMPGRVRVIGLLALLLATGAAISGPILHVYDAARGAEFGSAVGGAARAVVLGAAAAAILSALITAYFGRVGFPRFPTRYHLGRGPRMAIAAVALIAVSGGFVAVKGSPVGAIQSAWRDFKTRPTPTGGASRFGQSLGSNRYDFWRVAVGRFEDRPLTGIGADNFQEAYLARRRSDEAPRYPHSVELRTLSQTGLVGALLLLAGVGAALVTSLRAARARSAIGSVAAIGATMFFVYWVLHGSLDWFWEFPALGAPAFALLGMGAGLAPRVVTASRRRLTSGVGTLAVLISALVLGACLAAPWLSEAEVNRGLRSWTTDPPTAYDQLTTAASLNPLNARPKLLAGSIAARLGQYDRARAYLRSALERDPGDAYAHLELGTIVAQSGDRTAGSALLERATQLNPRDDIARAVLERIRQGRVVDLAAVNRKISERSVASGR